MKRIFIAVDISETARLHAAKYIHDLRGEFGRLLVGWERPEKLHITLKFLGEVEDEKVAGVVESLTSAAGSIRCFEVELSGTGVFPSPSNPRILWLGLHDQDGKLSTTANAVESGCALLGYKKEKREFSPHLTIARLREPQKAQELAARHRANKFELVSFKVSEIVIYESKLQPSGSIYSKLAAVPLL